MFELDIRQGLHTMQAEPNPSQLEAFMAYKIKNYNGGYPVIKSITNGDRSAMGLLLWHPIVPTVKYYIIRIKKSYETMPEY